MSLAIQVDEITAVLLADGWHDVHGKSFDIDSYEFKSERLLLHGGGRDGISASGFDFTAADGIRLTGPLSSILAVRRKSTTPAPVELPEWCGECGKDNPAARTNPRFRTSNGLAIGDPCPNCHPGVIAAV